MIDSVRMHGVYKTLSLGLAMTMAMLCSFCGSPQVDMGRSQKSLEPTDYQDVFRRWTRDLRIIPVDGVENVLTASGTYMSHEFRFAYVVRKAHDLRLTAEERQNLKAEQFSALDEHHEFFVTLMSGVDKSDDLDPEKGSWSIRLEDDSGRRLAPTLIEKVRKPSIEDTTYFNFDSLHRAAYRITFPVMSEDGNPILKESTQFFLLQFSSPLGQGSMRWEIE